MVSLQFIILDTFFCVKFRYSVRQMRAPKLVELVIIKPYKYTL